MCNSSNFNTIHKGRFTQIKHKHSLSNTKQTLFQNWGKQQNIAWFEVCSRTRTQRIVLWLSAIARVMELRSFSMSLGRWQLPLKQRRADLSSEKETRHRIHPSTSEYGSLLSSLIRLANSFKNTVPSRPILQAVEKTNGVKHPCSISWTLEPYSRCFLSSCCL